MSEFNVGDIVYIKDDFVEVYKRLFRAAGQTALAPGQDYSLQISLAKDIPFTIIAISSDGFRGLCITNFNDSWGRPQNKGLGFPWNGKEYKTWKMSEYQIEKRERNTISLYELNKSL